MVRSEQDDRLTFKLIPDVTEFLKKKVTKEDEEKQKEAQRLQEEELEEDRKSMGFLRSFEFLSDDEDFGILQNVVVLKTIPSRRFLVRQLDRMNLSHQWVLDAYFCVDTFVVALRERALDWYVQVECPVVFGAFVEFLLSKDLQSNLNECWPLVLHDNMMLASKRTFKKNGVCYLLLLPYEYSVEAGFLEPTKMLGNTQIGWSPANVY